MRNVRDTIPKGIGFFLVKASQEKLQFELYAQINKNEHLTKQLGEPERVTEERKQLNTTLETLKTAVKVLQRDPDITNTYIADEELEGGLREAQMDSRREDKRAPDGRGPPPGGHQQWQNNGNPGSQSSGNLRDNPQNVNPQMRPMPNQMGQPPLQNPNMQRGPGGPNPNMGMQNPLAG